MSIAENVAGSFAVSDLALICKSKIKTTRSEIIASLNSFCRSVSYMRLFLACPNCLIPEKVWISLFLCPLVNGKLPIG